ncbi:hypothetical protein GCM10010988_18660 [Cnuibacter physcomitrellae]|nr:hypothetical protein GCM10010988_18660 [Cnuibacter physcomitrellae]
MLKRRSFGRRRAAGGHGHRVLRSSVRDAGLRGAVTTTPDSAKLPEYGGGRRESVLKRRRFGNAGRRVGAHRVLRASVRDGRLRGAVTTTPDSAKPPEYGGGRAESVLKRRSPVRVRRSRACVRRRPTLVTEYGEAPPHTPSLGRIP